MNSSSSSATSIVFSTGVLWIDLDLLTLDEAEEEASDEPWLAVVGRERERERDRDAEAG